MGWFDWIWKYKFDNEKQTLIDMRTYTIDWYNQVTEPLKPILTAIQFNEPNLKAEEYARIARDIYEMKITSNAGEQFSNVLDSMSERGIPLFTSRQKLKELAARYQHSGHFVKDLAIDLFSWKDMSLERREIAKQNLSEGWQNFESAKDALVAEINHQIRRLG